MSQNHFNLTIRNLRFIDVYVKRNVLILQLATVAIERISTLKPFQRIPEHSKGRKRASAHSVWSVASRTWHVEDSCLTPLGRWKPGNQTGVHEFAVQYLRVLGKDTGTQVQIYSIEKRSSRLLNVQPEHIQLVVVGYSVCLVDLLLQKGLRVVELYFKPLHPTLQSPFSVR